MKKRFWLILFIHLFFLSYAYSEKSLATRVSEKALDGTVKIIIYYYHNKDNIYEISSGSGFLVNHNGYIVTNHHVVDTKETIQKARRKNILFNPDRFFYAVYFKNNDVYITNKIICKYPNYDLAVIKIDPVPNHTPLPLYSYKLNIQMDVLAIGNPSKGDGELINFSVEQGRITHLNPIPAENHFLMTNADVYYGNSGGPLLNLHGQVVGIIQGAFNDKMIGNKNLAIKVLYLRSILEKHHIPYHKKALIEEKKAEPVQTNPELARLKAKNDILLEKEKNLTLLEEEKLRREQIRIENEIKRKKLLSQLPYRLYIKLGGGYGYFLGREKEGKNDYFANNRNYWMIEGIVGYRGDTFSRYGRGNIYGLFFTYGGMTKKSVQRMISDQFSMEIPLKDKSFFPYKEIEIGFLAGESFRLSGGLGSQNGEFPMQSGLMKNSLSYYKFTTGFYIRFDMVELSLLGCCLTGKDIPATEFRVSAGLGVYLGFFHH